MEKRPKVSILIPLHNAARFLAQTLESCLHQTYDNIEIIVVDDGSTDSSLQVAREYEKAYAAIAVYTQKNRGAPAARNMAFRMSTGDFVQYLDADDLLHPDKIRSQVAALRRVNRPAAAFGPWVSFQHDASDARFKTSSVNRSYEDPGTFLIELWGGTESVPTVFWLLPRALIEKADPWDETLLKNQDGEFFARVLLNAERVIFVEESIAYYRKGHDGTITRRRSREAEISILRSYDTYCRLMEKRLHEREVRRALALVYSDYIFRLYPDHPDLIRRAEQKIKALGFKGPFKKERRVRHVLSSLIGVYRVLRLRRSLKKITRFLGPLLPRT
jgi:glycosyltransferase involved in cell wall biosynthesis